jgi:hypothetical protein
LPPLGLGEVHGPWYYAIQRCLSACDSMSAIVRATCDADLENISPYMIFCIFVAARFYLGGWLPSSNLVQKAGINNALVHAKVLSVEVPRNLDLLVFGLKTCGQRWSFAREDQFQIFQVTLNLHTLYRSIREGFVHRDGREKNDCLRIISTAPVL